MRFEKLTMAAMCAVVCVSLVSFASADDMYDPGWRGTDGTLQAAWEDFLDLRGITTQPKVIPAELMVRFGEFVRGSDLWLDTGTAKFDAFAGRTNVFQTPDFIDLDIGDDIRTNPWKTVLAQITTWGPISTPQFYIELNRIGSYEPGLFSGNRIFPSHTDVTNHGDEWYTYAYTFRLFPNPEREILRIDFDFPRIIDQVNIDTQCAPEPASLALLALGGLAMLRRKRK